jgi:hypothetical protein
MAFRAVLAHRSLCGGGSITFSSLHIIYGLECSSNSRDTEGRRQLLKIRAGREQVSHSLKPDYGVGVLTEAKGKEKVKPVRSKERPSVIPLDADLKNGWNPKYFWAFVVWNLDAKKIQILEISPLFSRRYSSSFRTRIGVTRASTASPSIAKMRDWTASTIWCLHLHSRRRRRLFSSTRCERPA